ncbi:putative nucleotidyltransferase with HDIG domain [Hypnocyclicus thermotrophus]|uniref:Nucleotidyltransferase with HDIG domain n=1 Tax=Hypnocyclicus thermotrophus TaxID=1627895 RepID=A0AA46DZT4_9FUSO|nr:HD-GYP domain-containing protein [Hypnocyclicus thermotrophus]TDT71915.1 putative nucleotidyltransferase with HDIG domain [Hypnocyclicus thermotrophus]
MKILIFSDENLSINSPLNFELAFVKTIEELLEKLNTFKDFVFSIIKIGNNSKKVVSILNKYNIPFLALYNNKEFEDANWYLKNGAKSIITHDFYNDFNLDLIKNYLKNNENNDYKLLYEFTKILRLNLDIENIILQLEKFIKNSFNVDTLFIIKEKYYYRKKVFNSKNEAILSNHYKLNFLNKFNEENYYTPINFEKEKALLLPIINKNDIIGKVLLFRQKILSPKELELLNIILSQFAVVCKNYFLLENSKNHYYNIVKALIKAIEAKDKYTKGHTSRVAKLSKEIALILNLPKNHVETIEMAAFLHDVGKIGIRDSVLLKPGKLSNEEYEEIKKHPEFGFEIIKDIEGMDKIAEIIKYHHERWDGKGYPEGLKGYHTPLEARIIAIADCYDAMTTARPYRKALSHEIALKEIKKYSGSQFDPILSNLFIKNEKIFKKIILEFN